MQSAVSSAAALDLASGQPAAKESTGWASFARHRPGQQSLPSNNIGSGENGLNGGVNGSSTSPSSSESALQSIAASRLSQDMKYYNRNGQEPVTTAALTPPKLLSSYSANDVPTIKSTIKTNGSTITPSHAQKQFHNHNVSLGRIPHGAVSNRQSREPETPSTSGQTNGFASTQSSLQASVPPFAPSNTQTSLPQQTSGPPSGAAAAFNPYNMGPQGFPPYGYNMQMIGMQMANMNLGPDGQPPQFNAYGGYPMVPPQFQPNQQAPAPRDSQARVIAQRRQQDGEGLFYPFAPDTHKLTYTAAVMNRFANTSLESLRGEIYNLCKDQHGCRFLQKKLEEYNPDHIHMIWEETHQHVVELMTDPFGNYLCQKLLEHANDEERTALIKNASPELVNIALNQHGTRALQKMIEFINTPEQVQLIIEALKNEVVRLIQDLNGNHVIQKCLNKLSSPDAQFIFDAVGINCVEVGTHRHGCCVLQRCIDHASGDQKKWLIEMISQNSLTLVQDSFGNYVVQYILDLNEPTFTEPLVARFKGRVVMLSKQKFSSNVVEKALRVAEVPNKEMIVEEILAPGVKLEELMKDAFANYVVQTAMDYCTGPIRTRLIDAIRPLIPLIRHTPYGRRIQAKVQSMDARPNGSGSGTPTESNGQTPSLRQQHSRSTSNASQGGFNPSSVAFNPSYAGGRQPGQVFPAANYTATHGMNAYPQFKQAYQKMAERPGAANGATNGATYF